MKDKSLKIKPMGKRLLVQLNPIEEKKTEGGVILPDTHSQETRTGIIIAVGEEVDKKYQPGDKIIIAFTSGTILHFPAEGILDDTIRITVQSEIMAKISEE